MRFSQTHQSPFLNAPNVDGDSGPVHSVIMELNVSPYRLDQAKANQQAQSLAKPSDSTS